MACACGNSGASDTTLWNVQNPQGVTVEANVVGEFNAKVKAVRIGGKAVKAS